MDTFVDKHISLSNKNKHLIFAFGCKQDKNIFKNKIFTTTDIDSVMNFIKSSHRNKKKYYKEHIFTKRNEEIKLVQDEKHYSINTITNAHIDTKCLSYVIQYKTDQCIIPSYTTYDEEYEQEVIEYTIENAFRVKIIIRDNNYYLQLIVYKPCNKKLLTKFINEFSDI